MAHEHLARGVAEGDVTPIVGLYGIQERQDGPSPLETHDHAICRLEGGRVVHHLALERYTRRRHDNRLHVHIEALAPRGFLSRGEEAVLACADSFVGRAFVSSGGRWRVEAAPATDLATGPVRARSHVDGREMEAWIVPHELAHLGASLPFSGGWEDGTLLIHVDGAASRSCCSAWRWIDGRLVPLHHGWDLADAVAGYATNNLAQAMVGHTWREFLDVPGKLMGLAAWGTPDPEVRSWLDTHGWFARMRLGPAAFEDAARRERGWTGRLDPMDPLLHTVAACFQARFEEEVLAYVERFAVATGARHLVLSGGGALNLPTNQRIVDAGWFDDVLVPPCAGDDGLALGAAALVAFLRGDALNRHAPFLDDLDAPALGHASDAEIAALADALARGEIVGTCLGAAEVGPRALGRRSLLARPTVEDARRVSVERKGREPWRPVAPIVLAERADALFEGSPSRSQLAPWMLGRFRARPEALAEAPGVVHVDGTARVQVVGHGPALAPIRRLLEALWARHHIPCLVNTSFNRRGEPLVQTLAQAREAAAAMGVDRLWHGGGVEAVAEGVAAPAAFSAVSADLVTWRADTLSAAVGLGLFDALPLTDAEVGGEPRRRLLAALGEMGFVARRDGAWIATERGALMRADHPLSLGAAARYWAQDGRAAWAALPQALADPAWRPADPFAAQAADADRVRAYHAAMAPYARHDYAGLPAVLDPGHHVLVDAGGGHGALALAVLRAAPALRAFVLDRPEVVASAAAPPADLEGRLTFVAGDLFEPWELRADALVLARVLHDWNDAAAAAILRRARAALLPGGRLYIVEMVRPAEGFDGALLDLHMLLATGGSERTEAMFRALLARTGFALREVRPLPSVSSVLVAEGV
ncbi:MAG: carbamoyltransferase C-terminal domain-containing protein [Myxococcota bacterium]